MDLEIKLKSTVSYRKLMETSVRKISSNSYLKFIEGMALWRKEWEQNMMLRFLRLKKITNKF